MIIGLIHEEVFKSTILLPIVKAVAKIYYMHLSSNEGRWIGIQKVINFSWCFVYGAFPGENALYKLLFFRLVY